MTPASFPGHELQARREELGLSYADVFEQIRVPVEYIRALEAAELERLPAYTYSSGFLATYCQFLDLEPELYTERLRSCMRRRVQAPSRQPTQTLPASNNSMPQPAWVTECLAWGTICGLIMLAWVTYSIVVRPWAEDAESRVEAGQVGVEELLPTTHFQE